LGLCARRLFSLTCLLASAPFVTARAQLAPVGVPRGVVRVELDGRMDIWDSQYLDGTKVPLSVDLISSTLGSAQLPFLTIADAQLQRITGIGGYHLDLGGIVTDAQRDESRGTFGLSVGLTRTVTIFGRIPLVRARAESRIALDPTGADAGLNPGGATQDEFFTEMEAALTTLETNIGNGTYSANPSQLALAQSTLASGNALADDLFGLLADPSTASPFVPTGSSAAGTAVTASVAALQGTLANDLGVTGFTATPALPAGPLTSEELVAALTSTTGPVDMRVGDNKVSFRGDAETGVAFTLMDHWDRDGRRGGFRAAVEGLVRWPTGVRSRADRLFATGTGDGQTDVEMKVTADLGAGAVGVRLEGDYNRQLAADITALVSPPSQPLAGSSLISIVRNDPGDVTTLTARPFLRLARTLALQGTVTHWSRGADAVTYATPASEIPGVDASVLAVDTKATATVLGIGLTYANPGALRPGGRGLPVDAGWIYERVVKATGGRVANAHAMTARLRVYFGLF